MNAVAVHALSKKYKLYDNSRARIKEFLCLGGRKYHRDFWALRDLDFEVKSGQSVGIIGRNGAGKSTLLKILAGVSSPTSGSLEINGRVSALLELGAGFHPEFSGRENIYMNAAILGIGRREIENKFKEIIEFSELSEFIDLPIKFYSSGMIIRLGFSVAINLDPEVLIIDEALAVGDMTFQKKCLKKMRDFKKRGTTIILVTHNLGDLGGFCERVLLLEGGTITMDDSTEKVIQFYRERELKREEEQFASATEWNPLSREVRTSEFTKEVEIIGLEFYDANGEKVNRIKPGSKVIARILFDAKKKVINPLFRLEFFRDDGIRMFGTNNFRRGTQMGEIFGQGEVEIVFESMNLNFGKYYVSVGVSNDEFSSFSAMCGFDFKEMAFLLEIDRDFSHGGGLVYCPNEWRKIN